jgi:hypothetical protein
MVSDMPVRVGLLVTESFPRKDLSSLSSDSSDKYIAVRLSTVMLIRSMHERGHCESLLHKR